MSNPDERVIRVNPRLEKQPQASSPNPYNNKAKKASKEPKKGASDVEIFDPDKHERRAGVFFGGICYFFSFIFAEYLSALSEGGTRRQLLLSKEGENKEMHTMFKGS